jgi:hypothetical protein
MGSKISPDEVIKRIREIHKDKYDLSKVVYVNKRTKITLICKEHGPWLTNVEQIYRGQGCTICGKLKAGFIKRLTFEDFELKAHLIHNSKYKYFKEKYIKSSLPTQILCPKHGLFNMVASVHIGVQKSGCPHCGFISQKSKRKMSLEDFKIKANLVHSNKYNYKLTAFNNQKDFVKIICKKHGQFEQNVSNHLTGSGCPDCNNSKGENKVKEILIKHKIHFIQQKSFRDLKDITLLKCDFYLPKFNCVIEFNGRQHYEIVEKFGGEKGFLETKRRDELKKEFFRKNKINYIEIHFKEKEIEQLIFKFLNK